MFELFETLLALFAAIYVTVPLQIYTDTVGQVNISLKSIVAEWRNFRLGMIDIATIFKARDGMRSALRFPLHNSI